MGVPNSRTTGKAPARLSPAYKGSCAPYQDFRSGDPLAAVFNIEHARACFRYIFRALLGIWSTGENMTGNALTNLPQTF
jgi:hypothetical protein